MGTQQQFCLRWNNHQSNMLSVFDDLFQNEALVDVTLACDGLSIKAHKMVLSACSPYFQSLFLDNPCKHPIVILKDIRFSDLKALMDFMYKGEVNVSQEQLSTLLKTAETLKVRGLTEVAGGSELHNSLLAQPGLAQQLHQQQSQPQQTTQLPRSSIPSSAPPLPQQQQQTQPPQHQNPSSPSPKRKKLRQPHRSDRSSSQSEQEDSDSHELIEPKVEIMEDNVDDERSGDGSKVMRIISRRPAAGSGVATTNDFTTNTSQGVSSTHETNTTTEAQGFPGRGGNVVNLNTPPLLFNSPAAPATVQPLAPVQSIGQPPVLQGSSQALPQSASIPILMPGSTMMNLPSTPSTSRQDSVLRRIPERLRPRPCKICSKIISNASNMIKHMLVHNPVKIPFRCSLCDCKYSREETLRWHYKVKHGITRFPLGRETDDLTLGVNRASLVRENNDNMNIVVNDTINIVNDTMNIVNDSISPTSWIPSTSL